MISAPGLAAAGSGGLAGFALGLIGGGSGLGMPIDGKRLLFLFGLVEG